MDNKVNTVNNGDKSPTKQPSDRIGPRIIHEERLPRLLKTYSRKPKVIPNHLTHKEENPGEKVIESNQENKNEIPIKLEIPDIPTKDDSEIIYEIVVVEEIDYIEEPEHNESIAENDYTINHELKASDVTMNEAKDDFVYEIVTVQKDDKDDSTLKSNCIQTASTHNYSLNDGTVKKTYSRKVFESGDAIRRKAFESGDAIKKRKGRPPKSQISDEESENHNTFFSPKKVASKKVVETESPPQKKRRGRPPKPKIPEPMIQPSKADSKKEITRVTNNADASQLNVTEPDTTEDIEQKDDTLELSPVKKRRGRPPKPKVLVESNDEEEILEPKYTLTPATTSRFRATKDRLSRNEVEITKTVETPKNIDGVPKKRRGRPPKVRVSEPSISSTNPEERAVNEDEKSINESSTNIDTSTVTNNNYPECNDTNEMNSQENILETSDVQQSLEKEQLNEEEVIDNETNNEALISKVPESTISTEEEEEEETDIIHNTTNDSTLESTEDESIFVKDDHTKNEDSDTEISPSINSTNETEADNESKSDVLKSAISSNKIESEIIYDTTNNCIPLQQQQSNIISETDTTTNENLYGPEG